jgi:hypothetical protein
VRAGDNNHIRNYKECQANASKAKKFNFAGYVSVALVLF